MKKDIFKINIKTVIIKKNLKMKRMRR